MAATRNEVHDEIEEDEIANCDRFVFLLDEIELDSTGFVGDLTNQVHLSKLFSAFPRSTGLLAHAQHLSDD